MALSLVKYARYSNISLIRSCNYVAIQIRGATKFNTRSHSIAAWTTKHLFFLLEMGWLKSQA